MFIDIEPTSFQINYDKNTVDDIGSSCQSVLNAYRAVAQDTALQGNTYDAIRQRLNDTDIPLMQGIVTYCMYLAAVFDEHQQMIGSHFAGTTGRQDANLIGYNLEYTQRGIDALENRANELLSLSLTAGVLSVQISSLYQLKQKLQDRLDALINYENASASLYDEANALANTLKQGLKYSGSIVWTGGAWHSDIASPDWTIGLEATLETYWQKMVESARAHIYNPELNRFGGRQNGPFEYYTGSQDPELTGIPDILRNYPGYMDIAGNVSDVEALLRTVNAHGCGYTALANSTIEQYYYRPEEFERTFGFPLFRDDRNGNQIINFEPLIVDLYCAYTTEYANEFNTQNGTSFTGRNFPQGILPGHTDQIITTDFFSDYVASKTNNEVNVDVELNTYDPNTDLSAIMRGGNHVIISAYNPSVFTPVDADVPRSEQATDAERMDLFVDPNTGQSSAEGHAVSLVQTSSAGDNSSHVFSCWGNEYTISDLGVNRYGWIDQDGQEHRVPDMDQVQASGVNQVFDIGTRISTVKWSLP